MDLGGGGGYVDEAGVGDDVRVGVGEGVVEGLEEFAPLEGVGLVAGSGLRRGVSWCFGTGFLWVGNLLWLLEMGLNYLVLIWSKKGPDR